MNGYGGHQAPPVSPWAEHHTPDGRAYYYNSATQVTQWTKPEEMMTPAERALSSQPWKEYTAEGGRKYWYNTETKQSSWEMPEVFKAALGHNSVPAATPYNQGNAQTGYDSHRDPRDARDPRDRGERRDRGDYRDHRDHRDYRDRDRDRDSYADARQLVAPIDPKIKAFVPANDDPDYATLEEAEAAFAKLLRRSGVQPDWSWEQAIRASAKDPQFRAIKDPKDRRAAFEKYCQDVVTQDKERTAERMAKLRTDFETMLKRHPEIKHYTRWKAARPIIEGETIFRSTSNENERRHLFEEYIQGLRKAHKEKQTSLRKSAMDGLLELLPKLDLEPYSSWSEAQATLSSTPTFQDEEKYKSLTQYDILTAFQNHMRALERAFNDAKQEEKNKALRKERKAREAFKSLLVQLRSDGKIKAGATWSQILPLIAEDERYIAMASNEPSKGSTAQELFWDVVEEEERNLRGPRNHVLDVLEDKRVEITPTSDLEEFMSIMRDDRRTANIDPDLLKLLFDRLREKRNAKRDEQPERHQRRTMDDLRVHLKRMDPPVTLGDTFDKVRPRILKVAEFQSLPDDALHSAFDRHMRRLREKDEDMERSARRSSEREVPRRDGDRARSERSHRSGGGAGGRRRSRSPELDPYEADRRKAIAERERNHRKSTMAESLLASERGGGGRPSPPPPARRERDRDPRDYDRPSRSRRDLDDRDYDRRDREEERDRYRRRGADRGSYDELPYGDERPAGSRRRRQDEEDDRRDSKRPRRDRSRERTSPRGERPRGKTPPPAPRAAAAAAPDTAGKDKDAEMLSGSEEGEIEE